MRCIFSDLAETDLEAIGDYIAQDNPARALSFVQELRSHSQRLTNAPKRAIVDWIDGMPVRIAPHGNYNIYFSFIEDEGIIYIMHIRHGSRQKPELTSMKF